MSKGLMVAVKTHPDFKYLGAKTKQLKKEINEADRRMVRRIGDYLARQLRLEYLNSQSKQNAAHTYTGGIRKAIGYKSTGQRRGASVSVGLLSTRMQRSGANQDPKAYFPSVLSGWNQRALPDRAIVESRILPWMQKRGITSRSKKALIKIAYAILTSIQQNPKVRYNFLYDVFQNSARGAGIHGMITPRYARRVMEIRDEEIKNTLRRAGMRGK